MRRSFIGCVLGSVAAMLSMLSVFLSSAPFTPAIVVNVIAVPLAFVGIVLGAWRTGLLTMYWALCAGLVSPNVVSLVRVDYLLVLLHLLGGLLAVGLFMQYKGKSAVATNAA